MMALARWRCLLMTAVLLITAAGIASAQDGLPLPPKPLKPDFTRPAAPEAPAPAPETTPPQADALPAETATPPAATTESTPETQSAPREAEPSPALRELQAQYEAEPEEDNEAATDTAPRAGIDGSLVVRALTGLIFICGLIIVLAWLARRFGARTPLLAGASLGQVLGRVHLTPKVALHYVRSGGRVLVVAVTPTNASLITEYEAEAFEQAAPPASANEKRPHDAKSFLDHLRAREKEQAPASPATKAAAAGPAADDLADLQGDIERLRNHLRESARELEDA